MFRKSNIGLMLTVMLGGCAAAVPGYVPPSPKYEKARAAAPIGGGFDPTGNYALSKQETELDCKRLTGGITVKILQMRDRENRKSASSLSTSLQTAVRPAVGGTTYAVDLDADYRRDRKRLEALNARLIEKKCKSFDIDAQLKPGNTETPTATVAVPKG
ncbi:MAG: hypothetical protein R3D68_14295 [Hyphomicrobiaceae bacterium]